jgi:hypothetical protein
MIKKLANRVVEEIEVKFDFGQELMSKVYEYFAEFSDTIEFKSGGYSYSSLEDLENNIGLFDFRNWSLENFGSKGNNAATVELKGKSLRLYYSDLNSTTLQNFQGKIKNLINEATKPKKDVIQLITETTVQGNITSGKLSFYQANKSTVKTAAVSILGTVASGLILYYVFHVH